MVGVWATHLIGLKFLFNCFLNQSDSTHLVSNFVIIRFYREAKEVLSVHGGEEIDLQSDLNNFLDAIGVEKKGRS